MTRPGTGLVLILAVVAAGCQSQPAGWDAAISAEALVEVGLTYYWRSAVSLDRGEKVARIWHVDENIYCLNDNNRLCVYDANSGTFKWSKQLGRPRQRFFGPTHVDRVMMTSPGTHPARAPYNVVVFNTVADALVYRRDTPEGHDLGTIKVDPSWLVKT